MSALTPATVARLRGVPPERTPQRLDPLGAQTAWGLVPAIAVLSVGYAVVSTLLHGPQVVDPPVAVAAIVLLAVTGAVASIRTRPGLVPFGRWSHLSVTGGALLAAVLFSASAWGANQRIQDDWGQIAVGLFLIAMPLYRPVGEVIAVGATSALVLAALAAFQSSTLLIHNNPLVYAIVAATPVLALACGGAGYAWTMTEEALRWRLVARDGQERLDRELRLTAERMIAQERATALNADAVPFLLHLLAQDAITESDRERAEAVGAELRSLSLRAVERTWLRETVRQALRKHTEAPLAAAAGRVDDPDGLEAVLSTELRGAVGALVAAVARQPGLDPSSLRITASHPEQPRFELTATVAQPRSELRRELLPFLGALSSTSLSTGMSTDEGRLVVRFAYPGSRRR
ncbi:hypothetical protein [Leifsonia sp. AG29]|uniref:hypothetical protein n=1 Tax=Leifsonia sp. AG29 TaxID=2598860 RepID=UPI00131CAF8B|nr:hypothetical protein [Leifsonia sp. AG29]